MGRNRAALTPFGRVGAVAAAMVLAASPVVAGARHDGVYSSVVETAQGQMGVEIDIRTAPSPSVVLMICLDLCMGGTAWPAQIKGARLTFTVKDPDGRDGNGRPVKGQVFRYEGRLVGDRLILSRPIAPYFQTPLPRVRHPDREQLARLHCTQANC